MIVSGYKSTERQLRLFDEPLGNHGHVRHVIGNLAEELTVKLVGGRRHKTQSSADYCPDVSTDLAYYETKAVGRSRVAFIYTGRLIKDIEFTRTEDLFYVLWHHGADTSQATSVEHLRSLVLESMRSVYRAPFAAIARLCENMLPEPLNSGYGGTDRKTYGSGYRLHLNLLKAYLLQEFPNGCEGHSFSAEAQGASL